jgi:uncharacterized protein
MFQRDIDELMKRYAQIFPVICVTGPRQSGKTTSVRQIFKDHPYVSLENPDTRLMVQQDPRGFLKTYAQLR